MVYPVACSGAKANTANRTVAASNPSAVVSGAGTSAANGEYTYRGLDSGFPYYNLVGQPDSTTLSAITYNGSTMRLFDGAGTSLYVDSETGLSFPWQGTAWEEDSGDSPPPTVTQGS